MNHILIRFLISLFLLNFSYTDEFQDWLQDNKRKLKLPTEISFKAKIAINDMDLSKEKEESCYLFIDVLNQRYQLQILENVIYYDGRKTDRYNLYSKQLFRYKTDEILSDIVSKIISDGYFFDISKYDSSGIGMYTLKMDNNILDIHFSPGNDKYDPGDIFVDRPDINIYYQDNIYNCEFNKIYIQNLDSQEFENSLLYSKIDTANIQSKNNFFNFIK